MNTLIVAGGVLTPSFLKECMDREVYDLVIAADRGLDYLIAAGRNPDLILGDYDSLSQGSLDRFREGGIPVRTYPAEKNFTDTEAAFNCAIEEGSTAITLIGGCGGRLDHFLSNLHNLLIPLKSGIAARMIDERNEIRLIGRASDINGDDSYPADHEKPEEMVYELRRKDCFGHYISLIPITDRIEDLTLHGFRYPLEQALVQKGSSLCVSNELSEETATVRFTKGIAALVFSTD
jgi:thiamine pyrophosphokinase